MELAFEPKEGSDMKIGDIASAVGKGLVAGAFGTLALTVTTTAANKLRGMGPSTTPADAGGKILQIQPRSEEGKQRLNQVMHFGYGTAWGVPRAIMGMLGLRWMIATLAHFFAVWGAELGMLPMLRVAPPPTKWEKEELALDALHHLVYAGATTVAFNFLDRRSERAHQAAA
jgi:hypothetical protein